VIISIWKDGLVLMLKKVKIAQFLRQYTGNRQTVEVEGSTIRECLNDLVKQYPETKKWLFDANNTPLIIVLVNQEVVLPDKMDQKVNKSDKIDLIPMIAGG
jgi:molybdopterin converting factor small subunit